MSKTRESTLRRILPLSIAAVLLLAAAPQLPADEIAVAVSTGGHHGYQQAGLRVGIGLGLGLGYYGHHYYGHHRYYPYRHHSVYPYVYYRHPGYYGSPYGSHFGALDLNVKPKKTTQVYVDGNYVGTAANFDGWPQHLWLEKDSYEVIFYNPGYETVVRHVEVQPGVVIKIREDMRPGESVPVAELTAAKKPPASGPAYSRKAPREPAIERRERVEPPPRPTTPASPGVLDARPAPARVRISIAPADASVYLDGRFLGIAGEIGERQSGILIEPGEHVIEVVRPGYRSREVSFEAEPDGEVQLEIELDSGPSTTGFST